MSTAETLLELKERQERADKKIHRIEGMITQLFADLKKKYNVTTVARLKGLLKKKKDLMEKKKKKLEADVEVLEAEYEWD